MLRELHLFAGIGGGILGGMLLGHRCVCAVEIDPFCQQILLQRQRDNILPKFPIWNDINTFDGRPWKGLVDVVCGGFPCQNISAAGDRSGIEGEKSKLWREMARVVREVEPKYVVVENSPMLTVRGLGTVLGDLATLGFDAQWDVFSSAELGAPHIRERLWILAHSSSKPLSWLRAEGGEIGRSRCLSETFWSIDWALSQQMAGADPVLQAWQKEFCSPGLVRVDDGVPKIMDRLRSVGNAQVPFVAAHAWTKLFFGD